MKNETSSSTFQQQQKDAVTPTLQEHAESFDALIHEAFEQSNNGLFEAKERYKQADFSEVANEIWKELNAMDDSPIGRIINGAIYGATDQAVEIFSAMYEVFEKRLGETLTTTINNLEGYNKVVDSIVSDIQNDLDNGTFNPEWQREIPDGFTLKDYLLAESRSDNSTQTQEQSNGMER